MADIIKYQMSWEEVYARVRELPDGKCYGIPRGGTFISAMTGKAVSSPEAADYLVDDIIDSGETREHWQLKTGKEVLAIVSQDEDLGWIEFPWEREIHELPAESNIRRLLQSLGEDPQREGLQKTPERYVRFMQEFITPPAFEFTTFAGEGADEMIVQNGIPFYSLCEHHLAPFFGQATVAYIPSERIAGLSKLARSVELHARGLQNQERITMQVANHMMENLKPLGVAVMIRARHLCMEMRGVRKAGTETTTSCLLGLFKTDDKCRNEFLRLAHHTNRS